MKVRIRVWAVLLISAWPAMISLAATGNTAADQSDWADTPTGVSRTKNPDGTDNVAPRDGSAPLNKTSASRIKVLKIKDRGNAIPKNNEAPPGTPPSNVDFAFRTSDMTVYYHRNDTNQWYTDDFYSFEFKYYYRVYKVSQVPTDSDLFRVMPTKKFYKVSEKLPVRAISAGASSAGVTANYGRTSIVDSAYKLTVEAPVSLCQSNNTYSSKGFDDFYGNANDPNTGFAGYSFTNIWSDYGYTLDWKFRTQDFVSDGSCSTSPRPFLTRRIYPHFRISLPNGAVINDDITYGNDGRAVKNIIEEYSVGTSDLTGSYTLSTNDNQNVEINLIGLRLPSKDIFAIQSCLQLSNIQMTGSSVTGASIYTNFGLHDYQAGTADVSSYPGYACDNEYYSYKKNGDLLSAPSNSAYREGDPLSGIIFNIVRSSSVTVYATEDFGRLLFSYSCGTCSGVITAATMSTTDLQSQILTQIKPGQTIDRYYSDIAPK